MIIIRLMGGLGNQMFQYATGRALSLRRGVSLKLDLRTLIGGDSHGRFFELDNFQINAEIATIEECGRLCPNELSFFKRTIARITGSTLQKRYSKTYYHESAPFKWDSRIESCQIPIYLDGYWQSYRYFDDYRQQILNDLSPTPQLEFPLHIQNQISAPSSVGIHIRRKDYVTDAKTNREIGLCPIDYYLQAFEFIESRLKDVTYFVFTDDPDWVMHNLGQHRSLTMMSGQYTKSGIEDMILLSRCSHQIIANSSFSWWGAYLNSNLEKIVIYPAEWLISKKWDIQDLCPSEWFPLSMRNNI